MADPRVVNEIIAIGRQRKVPTKYIKAALAIGRVESNFQNLNYGDADSKGWRQERASIYKDPTNLQASINRVYNEMAQHDRGQDPGSLAADVQRPAAQYRDRYAKVLASGEPDRILARRGLATTGNNGGGSRTVTSTSTIPGMSSPGFRLPGGSGQNLQISGPVFDEKAYEDAKRNFIVGQMIARRNPNSFLLRSGLFSTVEPSRDAFMAEKTTTVKIPGLGGVNIPASKVPGIDVTKTRTVPGGGGPVPSGKGRRIVDGKPVTADLARVVALARRYGWKGVVSSGIRTKQQQLSAAASFGLQHYGPAGPLGSNHVEGHSGAIDVTDADGFEAALRRLRKAGYKGRLPFRGMADDKVHFSWTGH